MPPADDLEAEAERMLARSVHAQEKASRRQQALEWATQQRNAIEGTATSGDGLVRAAVDNTGMLVRLELSPEVQGAPPRGLSRAITAVVQRAVADAREKIERIYVGLLNEGLIDTLPPLLSAPPTPDVQVPLPPDSSSTHDHRGTTEAAAQHTGGNGGGGSGSSEADAEPYGSSSHTWFDKRPWYR